MKTSNHIPVASLLALSVAVGASVGFAADVGQEAPMAAKDAAVSQQVPQNPDAAISEHGLAAIQDVNLARLAINDGHVVKATELLDEAQTLLQTVEEEDPPVTLTTEVKVGEKSAKKDSVTEKPNLIPVLAEFRVFETLAPEEQQGPKDAQAPAGDKGTTPVQQSANGEAASSAQPKPAQWTDRQRAAAASQAREQWQRGDHQAAAETLKPMAMGLVSRIIGMPLKETSAHVRQAIALLGDSKYHEANLELKAIQDGLDIATEVVVEPVNVPAAGNGKQDQPS